MLENATQSSIFSKMSMLRPYFYLFPLLLFVVIFLLYPTYYAFRASMMENYSIMTRTYSGYGLGNYRDILNDRFFLQAVRNTIAYVIVTVPASIVASLFIASILNGRYRGTALFQTIFFLPMVTSVTAIGYAWRYMFNYRFGIINYLLAIFSVEPVNWLNSTATSIVVLCLYGTWSLIPFTTIVFLSSMQSINNKYYIIARIDGAKSSMLFLRITLPLMIPTVFVMTLLNTVTTFKVFDELFPLFLGRPGPFYNMYTIVYYIYEQMQGTSRYGFGRAAAASVLLFSILLISLLMVALVRRSILDLRRGMR